eukprot:117950-Heterocapsa_arctica.AAC.1
MHPHPGRDCSRNGHDEAFLVLVDGSQREASTSTEGRQQAAVGLVAGGKDQAARGSRRHLQ